MAITDGGGLQAFQREFIKFGSAKGYSVSLSSLSCFFAAAVLIALMLRRTKLGRSLLPVWRKQYSIAFFRNQERKAGRDYLYAIRPAVRYRVHHHDVAGKFSPGGLRRHVSAAGDPCARLAASADGSEGKVIGVVIAILVLQIYKAGLRCSILRRLSKALSGEAY